MQEHHADYKERGARVVAIGQGTGEEAAEICGALGADFSCYGDPGKRAYRAFQLPRASWWSVTAKPFFEDAALAYRRIRNASMKGSLMKHTDVLQLPGVAIVDAGGVVRYLHRSKKADDLTPTTEILSQLDRLAAD